MGATPSNFSRLLLSSDAASLKFNAVASIALQVIDVLVGKNITVAMQKTVAYENHAFVFIVSHGTVSSLFF